MPEPLLSRVRPIRMKRTLSLLVALAFLAGCGSAEQGSDDAAGKEPTPSTSDKVCVQIAKPVGRADLDGDGTRETLVVRTHGGESCPDTLAVAGPTGDDSVEVRLPTGEPPIRSGFGVTVPGRTGGLFVTRQDHPRGGFQLRVYAAGDDRLVELKVDDHPLVPFVALDVEEHPLSVDCADGGLVLTEAVAHEPVGVLFAWDVKRTSYAIDGTEVTPGPTDEIADNVLPKQLRSKYPDLVRHAMFPSCRAAG